MTTTAAIVMTVSAVSVPSGAAAYAADGSDRREVDLLGLRLPFRATVAITVMVLVVIFD